MINERKREDLYIGETLFDGIENDQIGFEDILLLFESTESLQMIKDEKERKKRSDRVIDCFENVCQSIDDQGEFESTQCNETFLILFEIQSHLIG